MISRASSFWSLRASLALGALFLGACSEEPRSVAGSCEDLPLYSLVYDEATETWSRIYVDGGPLSAEDDERIDSELNRKGPRCRTPVGSGTSNASGGAGANDAASGGSSGTGGSASEDASAD